MQLGGMYSAMESFRPVCQSVCHDSELYQNYLTYRNKFSHYSDNHIIPVFYKPHNTSEEYR